MNPLSMIGVSSTVSLVTLLRLLPTLAEVNRLEVFYLSLSLSPLTYSPLLSSLLSQVLALSVKIIRKEIHPSPMPTTMPSCEFSQTFTFSLFDSSEKSLSRSRDLPSSNSFTDSLLLRASKVINFVRRDSEFTLRFTDFFPLLSFLPSILTLPTPHSTTPLYDTAATSIRGIVMFMGLLSAPTVPQTTNSSALKLLLVNLSLATPSLKLVNPVVQFLQLELVPVVPKSLVAVSVLLGTTPAQSVVLSDSNAWI